LKRKYYHRPQKTRTSGKRRSRAESYYKKPRIDAGLKSVFRKIGVPGPSPFIPDEFQLKSLHLINDYDILVSAPTGAGKTWIASETIKLYLAKGLRVWYASPLKALSNSIYQEFCNEFGFDRCGILTGDRKENPDANVIVGTTEILRNQLYDSMHKGKSIRTDLVILDEAHYLSDPDRGVVWEEVLIYLPSRVRLLLLSATISNAKEACAWLKQIREIPNRVVRAEERPVPMKTLFLFSDGLIVPLGAGKALSPKVKKFLAYRAGKRGRRHEKINFGNVIKCMRELDLLPAIFFLKSRRDCDQAVLSCQPVDKPPELRDRLKKDIRKFLKDYPHLMGHRQMGVLINSMVGSHHGGQLPFWKMLIEKMMNRGYLEAIFSTSTVAAGVNFPARTVVLVQSDRYNGHEFADLTAMELHQMIGRAGRRGKDNIGFALIIPGLHQDPRLIYHLQDSPAEPITSQIHINFSMTLNLLLSHTPLEVKELLDRSFAAFQERKTPAHRKRGMNKVGHELWYSFKRHLSFLRETEFVDENDRLTSDGYWSSKLRLDQPLLIAEAIRKGALDRLSPEFLAGGLAPFVWDRGQAVELKTKDVVDLAELEGVFNNILDNIEHIRSKKNKRGFDATPIFFWPSAALFLWAKGIVWEQLFKIVPIDEGDMASLIMRTADHLRQVSSLVDSHPRLASVAKESIEIILREPVYIS